MATVEIVLAEQPDHVFVATGACPRKPDLTGVDGHILISAWDALLGTSGSRSEDLPKVILIIDEEYGHQGPTTAECLLDRGHEVDIITSQETIANFLGATTRPPLLTRLFKKGAQVF